MKRSAVKNRKLRFESLELRRLLAVAAGAVPQAEPTGANVWTVNTTDDPGTWNESDTILSLREAVSRAALGDTINFSSALRGATILLNGTELAVTTGITIDASSIGSITIDGGNVCRHFNITGGTSANPVRLVNLQLTKGYTETNGGAILNNGKTVSLTNCTISNCTAEGYGGAIYNDGGTVSIAGSRITGNTVTYSHGGGICTSGSLYLSRSVISKNSTCDNGGGIYTYAGSYTTMSNCEISGNASECDGAGICAMGDIEMVNCTVAGNRSTFGCAGGIAAPEGSLVLLNSIVTNNYARCNDQNIYTLSSFDGANNIIGFDAKFTLAPEFDSEGHLTNTNTYNLTLSKSSWAIDRGDNLYSDSSLDAAGNSRIVQSWKSTTVDIGAYEYQIQATRNVEAPSTVVTTSLDRINDTDGVISLREAILYARDGETVTFASSMANKKISLTGGTIHIDSAVSVDATTCGGTTINANGTCCVFDISGGTSSVPVVLTGLTIINGAGTMAGGVCNNVNGVLTIANCTIKSCSSLNAGGIYNIGTLRLVNTLIVGNSGDSEGGGLYTRGTAFVTNCTIANNSSMYGGGICVNGSTTSFRNTILVSNTASISGADARVSAGSLTAYNTLSAFTGWSSSSGTITYSSSLPLFTNAAAGDYTLPQNSQAVDVGSNNYISGYVNDLAGRKRIANGIVDLGAYEYQIYEPAVPLDSPEILTGYNGYCPAYGANRQLLTWTRVANAQSYELSYSTDGRSWSTALSSDTSAIVTGLPYGSEVQYRVRAIGDGTRYDNSPWSGIVLLDVCPMDIDNDGFIGPGDMSFLSSAWFSDPESANWDPRCDVDGDGFVGPGDRSFLSANWFNIVGVDDFVWPQPLAADLPNS